MLDTKLPEATALHALRAVGEKAPLTPILPHPAYISAQTRQTARQRGAFDVVVRGDLNPMWAAVNKLLTLSTFGSDLRPTGARGRTMTRWSAAYATADRVRLVDHHLGLVARGPRGRVALWRPRRIRGRTGYPSGGGPA